MITLLSLLSTAHADIAPTPPPSKQFTTYSVRVDGLKAGSDMVLVLHDTGETIRGYALFDAEKPEHQLDDGSSSRGGRFSAPGLFAMPRAAFEAYNTASQAEIFRQREACMNGEGCAHISRFSPRIAPPTGGVPCGADIQITTTADRGGPDAFTDVFTVTALSADACTLGGPTRVSLKGGEPLGAAPSGATVKAETGCATVTAAGGAVWGIAMLLAGWRRQR